MKDCVDHGRKGTVKGYWLTTRYIHGVRVQGHAHRMIYCLTAGVTWASIKGLVVRHKCDNPRCINPEHLEIGTVYDNNQDRHTRGRDAKGMANGNVKWTDEQVDDLRKYGHLSSRKAAAITGIPKSTIQQYRNGARQ